MFKFKIPGKKLLILFLILTSAAIYASKDNKTDQPAKQLQHSQNRNVIRNNDNKNNTDTNILNKEHLGYRELSEKIKKTEGLMNYTKKLILLTKQNSNELQTQINTTFKNISDFIKTSQSKEKISADNSKTKIHFDEIIISETTIIKLMNNIKNKNISKDNKALTEEMKLLYKETNKINRQYRAIQWILYESTE